MKRLLVFTENYAKGGANRFMVDVVNGLSDNFDQISIISNPHGIYTHDIIRLIPPATQSEIFFITRSRITNFFSGLPWLAQRLITLSLIIFEPLFLIINIVFFLRLIGKLKPDFILSCNGGYPAAQACLAMVIAARISSVPATLSIVSMPTPTRKPTWLYEKLLDALVWQSVNSVLVNAKSIHDALCNLRGAPSKIITVVHNGLEDQQISDNSRTEKNEKFVIGCISRMDRAKGVLFLLDAFIHLAKKHPEMHLLLAGQGDVSDELAKRIEVQGLKDRVQLLGHYEGDVSVLLASFDIYVFPSLWEGFPYSLLEALRSSSVIVATRVGGIPEAIADGTEGLLIEPGSCEEIILAVEKLLASHELQQILASNARARFERDFTLSRMHYRVGEFFARLHDERNT